MVSSSLSLSLSPLALSLSLSCYSARRHWKNNSGPLSVFARQSPVSLLAFCFACQQRCNRTKIGARLVTNKTILVSVFAVVIVVVVVVVVAVAVGSGRQVGLPGQPRAFTIYCGNCFLQIYFLCFAFLTYFSSSMSHACNSQQISVVFGHDNDIYILFLEEVYTVAVLGLLTRAAWRCSFFTEKIHKKETFSKVYKFNFLTWILGCNFVLLVCFVFD